MLFLRKNELFRVELRMKKGRNKTILSNFSFPSISKVLDKNSRSILLSGKVKEIFN